MITIAVIDKYPLLRKWVAYILDSHFSKSAIFEAKSVHAFLKTYPDCLPELIILEIGQNSSIAQNRNFIKLIKSKKPFATLIVYDEEYSDAPMVLQYINAGANGYLSKKIQ
ncbi:hypothetical protein [Dyadobacter sp. NIV53]|uniref:hypothetical protein n=1 Tax=Dyadobacter sp. NIV53 TaxID=2861765 RepID=UPI001C8821E0|nr:hypothetical protein [Dyadobacter sp. NIV53]